MGHADEKMILHVYAHLTDRQEQQSVDKLRRSWWGEERERLSYYGWVAPFSYSQGRLTVAYSAGLY